MITTQGLRGHRSGRQKESAQHKKADGSSCHLCSSTGSGLPPARPSRPYSAVTAPFSVSIAFHAWQAPDGTSGPPPLRTTPPSGDAPRCPATKDTRGCEIQLLPPKIRSVFGLPRPHPTPHRPGSVAPNQDLLQRLPGQIGHLGIGGGVAHRKEDQRTLVGRALQ